MALLDGALSVLCIITVRKHFWVLSSSHMWLPVFNSMPKQNPNSLTEIGISGPIGRGKCRKGTTSTSWRKICVRSRDGNHSKATLAQNYLGYILHKTLSSTRRNASIQFYPPNSTVCSPKHRRRLISPPDGIRVALKELGSLKGLSLKTFNEMTDTILLPDSNLTDRYRPIGQELQSRFGDNVDVKIPVRDVRQPHIGFALTIPRRAAFLLFIQRHRQIASRLIDIFLKLPDISTLIGVGSYVRDRVNVYLFQFASTVAVQHRPDTKNISSLIRQCFRSFAKKARL
ncbi:prophenoloxidase [Culex quinquefasciatus]|uniref:Prophenoloxidase n=1 Tax=Culex quinquefasciatus TaxID=7176 RepID=B0WEE7_CULQU|nr:prophenoloxidase [Culex quinquefasciatus]|eukprot:XP_001847081.1 prophenoloxidase [Culex quinquefasciatus]